jgi:hypothetical protein
MKKTTIAILSLLLISGATAFGQGTIFFANRLSAATFNPVYMPDGTTALSGAGFSAQLFADVGGSLTAVGSALPFRTGAGAGSWAGVQVAIPGAAPGTTVSLQVFAWDNNGGAYATYAAALAAGALHGFSPAFTSAALGGDPGGGGLPIPDPNIVGNANPLNNMQSFNMVPEPSTIALGILGAAALLLRRRR